MTINNINNNSLRNYKSLESSGLLFYGYINDSSSAKDGIEIEDKKRTVDYIVSYPFEVRPLPRRRKF